MDSRSGPEVPSKVHGFGEAVKLRLGQAPGTGRRKALGWAVAAGLLAACGPDLSKPEGALGQLAQGCAAGEAREVYSALDERSRFALDAIAQARSKAKGVIAGAYPEEARAEALAQLGDASNTQTGRELFALRCDAACVEQLCHGVSAPASVALHGAQASVRTVRGAQITLYRAKEHYGLVWQTELLARERRRAFAELSTIEANAKVYAQQKGLR
jgi:hypothetical protein